LTERLDRLEEFVWNSNVYATDEMDLEDEDTIGNEQELDTNESDNTSMAKIVDVMQQMISRMDSIENKVYQNPPAKKPYSTGEDTQEELSSEHIYNPNNLYKNNRNNFMNFATHNVRGFNDPIKRKLFFNHIKNNRIDITGISETNCNENKEKWYIDGKDKFRAHWSSNGMGAGVALIISKELNKYVCKVARFKGRAIRINLVLPRKTTICLIQVYLPSKKTDAIETISQVKNWILDAQHKNQKVIVMGDFNA
ncbi:4699_t:CDS:2, partial [Diversispora eburnea]